jgi:hypothetical protein
MYRRKWVDSAPAPLLKHQAAAPAAASAPPAAPDCGAAKPPAGVLLLQDLVRQQAATNRLLWALLDKADASHRQLASIAGDAAAAASSASAIQSGLDALHRLVARELAPIAAAARLFLYTAAAADADARLRAAVYCGRCCAHAALLLGGLRAAPRLVGRACAPPPRRLRLAGWWGGRQPGSGAAWQAAAVVQLVQRVAGVAGGRFSPWCSAGAAGEEGASSLRAGRMRAHSKTTLLQHMHAGAHKKPALPSLSRLQGGSQLAGASWQAGRGHAPLQQRQQQQ